LYPRVIVAPPSFCGYAPYWMSRKGSITLRRKTFQDYIFDVLHSLKTNGIHTLLVLNGHGGNQQPLKEMEETWRGKLGVTMEVDSVWAPTPPDFVKTVLESEKRLSHAEEYETSIALAAHPHRVRRVSMKEYDDANLNYESGFSPEVEHFLRIDGRTFIDGRINEEGENATDRARQEQSLLATAAKGEKLIARVVEYYVEKLQKMIAATESGQPWPPA
ncbi:MAG: creatininase family protein, partial [Acidobacteriota bacterium]|nr:creatininase family protein [Acidobacteriota bacterium]